MYVVHEMQLPREADVPCLELMLLSKILKVNENVEIFQENIIKFIFMWELLFEGT